MSMKKGYCTNCNKHDEIRRIFDVNSEAKFCYCPHCGKKYRPKVAIFNYERTIARYNRRAKFFLRNVGQPLYAYNLFAYVLELEPTNKTAKLGRLISLTNLSTLRRNHFSEVKELLDIARKDVKEPKNAQKYIDFLTLLDGCVNEYIHRVKKKLTFKGYFYDNDCIKLYFKNLRDSIALKRFVLTELSSVNDKKSYESVFNSIKQFELAYNETIYTVDGVNHTFTNFTKYGEPLITDGIKKVDTKLEKYRMSTLNKDNKKLIYIKDAIFSRTNLRLFTIYEKSFVFSAVDLVLAIGSLIAFLLLLNQPISVLFLILLIIFSVSAVAFLVMRLVFGPILKKPCF